MNTFVIIAACMVAIAAAAVAWPLLRERGSRTVGGIAILVIGASAAALYATWSNWDWHAPPPAPRVTAGQVLDMVGKLEQRLRQHPDDATGWLMLGRSYVALERIDGAVDAYQHAHQLEPQNADATLGLGEALSLRAGGDITPQAGELFEQALAAAPDNPKALLYGGFAAQERGDLAVAKSRWQALKRLNPPPQIAAMLDARIAELESQSPGGTAARDSTEPGALKPAAVSAEAIVAVHLSPALKSRLKGEAPLFVFAREPGGGGPPLAAKRLTTAALDSTITLTSADSMIPSRVLKTGQRVAITARVSFSGTPLPAAGDLFGEVTYDVGHDKSRELVIDRVAE